ncbi:hypothetical protein QNM99_20465 [Pseudomonas sp. PCH446]
MHPAAAARSEAAVGLFWRALIESTSMKVPASTPASHRRLM